VETIQRITLVSAELIVWCAGHIGGCLKSCAIHSDFPRHDLWRLNRQHFPSLRREFAMLELQMVPHNQVK
jgi:hypothetical protein